MLKKRFFILILLSLGILGLYIAQDIAVNGHRKTNNLEACLEILQKNKDITTMTTEEKRKVRSCIKYIAKTKNALQKLNSEQIKELSNIFESLIKEEPKNFIQKTTEKEALLYIPNKKMFIAYLNTKKPYTKKPIWTDFIQNMPASNKIKVANIFVIFQDINGLTKLLKDIELSKDEWQKIVTLTNILDRSVIIDVETTNKVKDIKEKNLQAPKPWEEFKKVKIKQNKFEPYDFPWKTKKED